MFQVSQNVEDYITNNIWFWIIILIHGHSRMFVFHSTVRLLYPSEITCLISFMLIIWCDLLYVRVSCWIFYCLASPEVRIWMNTF